MTAARNLRAAGVPEEIIMRIAGWKTSNVFKRYAIVDKTDVRAALQQLERARQRQSRQRPETADCRPYRQAKNQAEKANQDTTG
jgi:stage III sporulation protein SpoIIIAA